LAIVGSGGRLLNLDRLREQSGVGARCGASRRRSSLRADCPAVLGRLARRATRYAPAAQPLRSNKHAESVHVARRLRRRAGQPACAPRRLPGAPQRAPTPLCATASAGVGFSSAGLGGVARRPVPGPGDLWGGEQHSARVGTPAPPACFVN